ncbi:hypothetical protein BHE90_012745 [Fusarium euwallaceae]|uniref:Uncharacterized protein n=2 Tax=Fusarium solani species complex TaxID=232080 RepID=A0A430LAT8_9HYPO|nr:hypothetical protein CDV31_016904 [Fusarium ambrosium]RTE72833.1 hypothetical protein BHE90_012745 [Fusarium euwallaceae]
MLSNQARADETLFEWRVLGRSLQKSDVLIRMKFCLCLQILGLSLLEHYDGATASELLARDEASLLAPFIQVEGHLKPESFDYAQAHHIVALARSLLEELGGEQDCFQRRFDLQYSARENHVIYGAIVDIEGGSSMEETDPQQMHKAISQSKLIRDHKLGFAEVMQLMNTCQHVLEQDWVYV